MFSETRHQAALDRHAALLMRATTERTLQGLRPGSAVAAGRDVAGRAVHAASAGPDPPSPEGRGT
ncbi:hypothetical protein [Deinococcus hopiensis]|uniref:Uncharacterized protein n=1 Tax=Deinococcus hopiensis KR-140 TaxID=695939 RepID=A0A1W1VQ74_9DEIO|nr:hypothetical protein [Deinococcus hopiensis]SMB95532.1 hypothetical protein SAMN00790413_02879 [Deinococcus hopiensis KR-140]